MVFVARGEQFIRQVVSFIQKSKAIHEHDIILITDEDTALDGIPTNVTHVIRVSFETDRLLRKADLIKFLPRGYDVYLYLDSDTVVIEDNSLEFEKADAFEIALAPALRCCMDCYWGFDCIMEREGIERKGQLLYNSGAIFFKNTSEVRSVFSHWMVLAQKYRHEMSNDQSYLSLAMEELGFNPYTQSSSYNYRGIGDAISGVVRVWHSHSEMPKNVNEFDPALPLRRAWPARVVFDKEEKQTHFVGLIGKVKEALSKIK